VAANRTKYRYRDTKRQWVKLTHLTCYDLGCGIYSSLISTPQYCSYLARIRETEQRSIAALRLASEPEVSSSHLTRQAVAFQGW